MAISTKINIEIAGEQLSRFSKLVVNQKVQSHHRFSVLQPLPKEFVSKAIEKAQQYVGQDIKITITPATMSTASPLVFNGIITEAQMVRTSGASGGIIINGYSPTILLEGAPHIKSFSDSSFSDVVNEVLKPYPAKNIQPNVDISNNATLPYTVQYNESDFSFLSRMAQKKGQWFFYNGEELFFGKPNPKKFSLDYGKSLHSFNIEMRAKSLGFEYLGYDPSNGETQKASSMEVNHQPDGYSKTLFESSKKLYPNNSTILYSHSLEEGNSKTHLVDRVTTQLHSRTADLVTAKGESDETGLRIGDIITIKEPAFSLTGNILDGLQEQNFGNYILTDIIHICDESGMYHNSFDAVPENVMAPPYGDVHSYPMAESQPATVISNEDPAGLGRIQVAFSWQQEAGKHTPWIRMTNPHSGGGKGFYFIPEVGEEVLIGFEGGNAEKPFVLGAMYNGGATSGYATSQNTIKAIHTRSGHIIKFTEDESIIITDKSGNEIKLDTVSSNINITAPNDINITAGGNMTLTAGKNISLGAGENITETAGSSIIQTASKDYMLMASDITEMASGEIKTDAENISKQATGAINVVANGMLTHNSEQVVHNKSGEKVTNA